MFGFEFSIFYLKFNSAFIYQYFPLRGSFQWLRLLLLLLVIRLVTTDLSVRCQTLGRDLRRADQVQRILNGVVSVAVLGLVPFERRTELPVLLQR